MEDVATEFEPIVIGRGTEIKTDGDEALLVEFYRHKLYDKDYIRIRIPGDKTCEYNQPARDKHKQRFAKHWRAYQEGQSQIGEGTSLAEWGMLGEAMVNELAVRNVFTVEQLAAVNDSAFPGMPLGIRSMRQKAKSFVGQKDALKENTELRGQLSETQQVLKAMQAQIDEMKKPKRGGRPKGSKNKPKATATSATPATLPVDNFGDPPQADDSEPEAA